MNEINFTPRARSALINARTIAENHKQNYIGTEHILLGLLELGQGVALSVLINLSVDPSEVRRKVIAQIQVNSAGKAAKPDYTPRARKVLALAEAEAKSMGHQFVGSEHLLLGLIQEGEGIAAKVLIEHKIDTDTLRQAILTELRPESGSNDSDVAESPTSNPPSAMPNSLPSSSGTPAGKGAQKFPALRAFGRNLNEAAKDEKLDPVIGRKKEVQRVIQVLSRRTKNNPVLLGLPGVGKTSIVEGLAQAIVSGKVPRRLKDKTIYTLDLALMVAGTKYRGQFEERIKTLMDEVKRAGNIILFLDEVHTLVGAGAPEGGMDASNILKPALSRGEIQIIGATTLDEYRKYIEKDGALERRFQQVKVEPPSEADSILILEGIKSHYEIYHIVKYTSAAIETCVKATARYLPARQLPDKAIDVMDEAGARARLQAESTEDPRLLVLKEKLLQITKDKELAITGQHYEAAAALRDQEKDAQKELDALHAENFKKEQNNAVTVNEGDVLQVLEEWTGIPLNQMVQTDRQKLLNLEIILQKSVIGQEMATLELSKSLRRAYAGIKDPKRPIGTFMLLGPTGTGKTHMAQTLAKEMFGSVDNLIQVDMSEYMEKFAISRLIGSPPGYVGYEEGGKLTEAVRRKPYSVILFDEIEKAHPDVMQLFLQVMEQGQLTDSLGRTVDFKNTIILMTTNVGSAELARTAKLGFASNSLASRTEDLQQKVLEVAKKEFRPEFLNRFTNLIVFAPLSSDTVYKITDIEVAKLNARLVDRKIVLVLTDDVRRFLLKYGYDEKFGARPLRRAIETYIENPLSEAILRDEVKDNMRLDMVIKDDKIVFVPHV